MKRLIVCLIVLILLTACAKNDAQPVGFQLYFPNRETADFTALPFDGAELSLDALVREYCRVQPPEQASSAIPLQWRFQSATVAEGDAVITFAGTVVSELQTNMAAACLLQTVLQIPDVDTLRLTAPGYEPMLLTSEDLLLVDSGMLPQKESIVLYVPDAEGRFLLHQTQTVEAVEAADKPGYILQQLFDTAASCIPKGTRLLNVSVEHEICTVDLSSEFLHNMHPNFHCERMAVYAVVNSLTVLEEIKTVDFWIEGAPLEELKFMKLTSGLSRDESLLAPTDAERLDAVLYASCDARSLVKIPFTAELNEEKTTEETVLDTLLSFTALDGAKNYIPEGTKRLSVLREGSNCIVDLTGEFLHGCKDAAQQKLAVQSVVATMCAIDGISTVEILVEGLEPDYGDPQLGKFTFVEDGWLAEK